MTHSERIQRYIEDYGALFEAVVAGGGWNGNTAARWKTVLLAALAQRVALDDLIVSLIDAVEAEDGK